MSGFLYKYTDIDSFINHVLKRKTLKFSRTPSFNDPFELSEHFNTSDEFTFESKCYLDALQRYYGILCLTKNPLNLLMWSHYASGESKDSSVQELMKDHNGQPVTTRFHTGLVFGIDPFEAGLSSHEDNCIPSDFGNVIYSTKKPDQNLSYNEFVARKNHREAGFDLSHYPYLRGTFLNKPMCWSYEEEVRVVRKLKFNPKKADDEDDIGYIKFNDIYDFDINSIKEIYIGLAHYTNPTFKTKFINLVKDFLPSCSIYQCLKDEKNWELKAEKI